MLLMERHHACELGELINVGYGEDMTIRGLAEAVARVVGFDGELRFDPSKPDGTPRKLLDSARVHAYGWRALTPLHRGLGLAYADFLGSRWARSSRTEAQPV